LRGITFNELCEVCHGAKEVAEERFAAMQKQPLCAGSNCRCHCIARIHDHVVSDYYAMGGAQAVPSASAPDGKWIPAVCIQNVIYPKVCEQLGWPPRPWMGKNGVAAYLAKQSPQPPKYLRVELAGEVHNFQHYYIPELQTATVSRIEPYPGSHQW
jgi:hypothetical protein